MGVFALEASRLYFIFSDERLMQGPCAHEISNFGTLVFVFMAGGRPVPCAGKNRCTFIDATIPLAGKI